MLNLSNKQQEELHETLQSPGWKLLEEALKAQQTALSDISNISNEHELYYNKGRLFETKIWLNLPAIVKQSLEQEDVV